MQPLRDVDAVCEVSAWTGHQRAGNHRLLPILRSRNDSVAAVC
nr:MAG TPA: hypothetical protein [Caudoviricetes sp.]